MRRHGEEKRGEDGWVGGKSHVETRSCSGKDVSGVSRPLVTIALAPPTLSVERLR